ncbi:MAG: PQQ-binding-like beta-propeller repeat protein [Nanoarchaeota archaeon]
MGILKEVMKRVAPSHSSLQAAWIFEAKSPILAPPLVFGAEKNIAFGTKDGRLVCISATGVQLWEYTVEHKLSKVDMMFVDEESVKSISSMPAYLSKEKFLLFGTDSGILQAVTESGKPQWQFKAKGPIKTTPLVADINGDGKEEVIFGSLDKYLYALNGEGKLIWAFNAGSQIESSPSYFRSRAGYGIVFGANNGTLYCLGGDGKEKWSFATKSPITATPSCGLILGSEDIFIAFGGHDSTAYILSEKGLKEWQFKTGGKILASISLADVNTDSRMEVCIGSTDDTLYLLSAQGGKLWQFESNFWIVAKPLIADLNRDGNLEIAVGSYDRFVYILSAEGEYVLDSMPGLSNLTSDIQNNSGLINAPAGRYQSKIIASYKTRGMVTGLSLHEYSGLLVTTSSGTLEALKL